MVMVQAGTLARPKSLQIPASKSLLRVSGAPPVLADILQSMMSHFMMGHALPNLKQQVLSRVFVALTEIVVAGEIQARYAKNLYLGNNNNDPTDLH